MSNKKKIVIVIAVFIVAILVSALIGFVIPTLKVKQTGTILSKIDAEELETKIIERLEQSPLNVNTETTITEFRTLDANKTKLEFSKSDEIEIYEALEGMKYNLEQTYESNDPYKHFILAIIVDREDNSIGVAIPCFYIESDDNGNFKSLERIYGTSWGAEFVWSIIEQEIENVFETEYNIDTKILENLRAENSNNKTINFVRNNEKIELHYNNEEFLVNTFKTISDKMDMSYGTWRFNQNELVPKKDIVGKYRYNIKFGTLILTIH